MFNVCEKKLNTILLFFYIHLQLKIITTNLFFMLHCGTEQFQAHKINNVSELRFRNNRFICYSGYEVLAACNNG